MLTPPLQVADEHQLDLGNLLPDAVSTTSFSQMPQHLPGRLKAGPPMQFFL
jgi:hypothetical protein